MYSPNFNGCVIFYTILYIYRHLKVIMKISFLIYEVILVNLLDLIILKVINMFIIIRSIIIFKTTLFKILFDMKLLRSCD